MTTKTVVINVATKTAIFPLGTVEEQYLFQITDAAGVVVFSVNTNASSASFSSVPEGSYVAKVSKNGSEASASFEIVASEVSLQVPDTFVVSLQ
jgi:hypothetical protein